MSSRRIPNDGARFENMVYLALRRRSRDISYFDADGECVVVPGDDSPRPEFKQVDAARLGAGLFTGEVFPAPGVSMSKQ